MLFVPTFVVDAYIYTDRCYDSHSVVRFHLHCFDHLACGVHLHHYTLTRAVGVQFVPDSFVTLRSTFHSLFVTFIRWLRSLLIVDPIRFSFWCCCCVTIGWCGVALRFVTLFCCLIYDPRYLSYVDFARCSRWSSHCWFHSLIRYRWHLFWFDSLFWTVSVRSTFILRFWLFTFVDLISLRCRWFRCWAHSLDDQLDVDSVVSGHYTPHTRYTPHTTPHCTAPRRTTLHYTTPHAGGFPLIQSVVRVLDLRWSLWFGWFCCSFAKKHNACARSRDAIRLFCAHLA